jgi:hypothetical protein
MPSGWTTTTFVDEQEALSKLEELTARRWLCRGQQLARDSLTPSIDRGALKGAGRSQKLEIERQSINLFRSVVRNFASSGEQGALTDDIVALMVLRHYGVPTRLLDWSTSPYVAAYFAVSAGNLVDGEIWAFDQDQYAAMGKLQWKEWPQTTTDGSGADDKFDAKLTAFAVDDPLPWFCCAFYPAGFPRQAAQHGAYSMAAAFDVDHAEAIANLLVRPDSFQRYVIKAEHKARIREVLRDKHGIWRGSLFPDSAGAAASVCELLLRNRKRLAAGRRRRAAS